MPTLGLQLGESLAAEHRQAGDADADGLRSFAGRLAFLRRHVWFTPAATLLGLPDFVAAQVAAFRRVAVALNAGAVPEDGAAALDRMDRDEAASCYLAQVSPQ